MTRDQPWGMRARRMPASDFSCTAESQGESIHNLGFPPVSGIPVPQSCRMPKPAPLPAELGSAFTYAHARGLGVSRQRLRASDLTSPHRGARLSPFVDLEPDDDTPGAQDRRARRLLMHRLTGFAAVRRPHTFVTGRTALGVFSLPFAATADADLCIGVLAPSRRPRMKGIAAVSIAPALAAVVRFEGIPVTSPASTWALLAAELSERDLTILADAIVRIPRGPGGVPQPESRLATPEQLLASAMVPQRRGRAKLLRALERTRVGSMSVLESEYRLDAQSARLPEPELDVEIRDAAGRLVGIADVVYRAQRVIVEVEGDQHRLSRAQWDRDLEKHAAYTALGWQLVRLSSRHIRRSQRGVDLVRTALHRRSP